MFLELAGKRQNRLIQSVSHAMKLLNLMRNAVELTLLTVGGLEANIVLCVRPIDADMGGERTLG